MWDSPPGVAVKGYCRACDAAVEVVDFAAWPGRCSHCRGQLETRPLPDVLPGADAPFRVLFCGINPGTVSARVRQHFANPANPFWRALQESGLTPALIAPARQAELAALGIGLTNVVARATPGSADIKAADIAHGRAALERLVSTRRPVWLAFVGKEAYRMATATPARTRVDHGEAGVWHGARAFVLPSTSPRNAQLSAQDKVAWFTRLRDAADA